MHTDRTLSFFKAVMPCEFSGFARDKYIREANRPNKPPSGNRVRAESSQLSKMLIILHFGKLRVSV